LSRRSSRRISRGFFALTVVACSVQFGCWEQWSDTWFPQMKRQKAIQAFEMVGFEGQIQGFTPPEGSVPVTKPEAWISNTDDAAADLLQNPRPMSLDSLENGRAQFFRYCSTCHGPDGAGDGPVSMTGGRMGPLGGVLPLAGPASIARVRSDGHIYTTIRAGRRRMPSYQRIPSDDRWDIVNYLRYINGQKGIGQ
jgi:mono/diheme cytochrome c family protein